ncbi:hypothetical protein RFI_10350, partial [Reticulomyxa filosa]
AELDNIPSTGGKKRRCVEQSSLLSDIKSDANSKGDKELCWEKCDQKTMDDNTQTNGIDKHDDNNALFYPFFNNNSTKKEQKDGDPNMQMTINWPTRMGSCQDVVMIMTNDVDSGNGEGDVSNHSSTKTITLQDDLFEQVAPGRLCFDQSKVDKDASHRIMFSEQSQNVAGWDQIDTFDDLACVPYINDIMRRLKETEGKYMHAMHPDYVTWQQEINNRMRIILLDWLIDVHRKFKLSHATLHLCVNLLDRYLGVAQVQKKHFQLVGCACLWLASKYHEIQCPEINDFLFSALKIIFLFFFFKKKKKRELIVQESKIVEALKFQFTVPTSLSFAQRFLKIGSYEGLSSDDQAALESLVWYLLDHCLMSYQLSRDLPSKIAASCLAYSLCHFRPHDIWVLNTRFFYYLLFLFWHAYEMGKGEWEKKKRKKKKKKPQYLEQETRYSIKDLYPTMKAIDTIVKTDKQKCKHKAVRKKYASMFFRQVIASLFFFFNTTHLDKINLKYYKVIGYEFYVLMELDHYFFFSLPSPFFFVGVMLAVFILREEKKE